MLRRLSLALAPALALSGCMMIDSISPAVRLGDQVHGLNDEVRWGRIDLAAQRVASSHRGAFIERHRGWGGAMRVADADVTNIDMAAGEGQAASYVSYQWIDEGTMELRTTAVRQLWRGEGEGFVLVDEQIIGGDESLLPGAEVASAAAGAVSEDGEISAGGEDTRSEAPAAAPAPVASARDAQGISRR